MHLDLKQKIILTIICSFRLGSSVVELHDFHRFNENLYQVGVRPTSRNMPISEGGLQSYKWDNR